MSVLALSAGCSSNEVVEKPAKPVGSVVDQSASADQDIKPYGQLVDVKGKKMNVLEVGEGKETIVWTPGYGDIAPGLSYTKMLEELKSHYRVLVVEPFGYGLRDVTDDPRTIEKPDDVPLIPEASDEVNEQYRKIAKKINANKNLVDEANRFNENLDKAKKYPFPTDFPVAFFLAKDSIEGQKMYPIEKNRDWVKMHTDLTKDSNYTKVYKIDGNHQLYLDKYKEITEQLNEFLANRPTES